MSDTKACTKCRVVKALTDFHKNRTRRDGRQEWCKTCSKANLHAYYLANKDTVLAKHKNYAANNRGARNAIEAKRRAAKLERTVSWGCKESIDYIYNQSAALTKLLGIEFQVDHIYPMQGELVSGLHVEGNLQIIPATLNQRKSNKFKVQ